MKKILTSIAAAIISSASLFAYNPPIGGEEFLRLANPEMLSGSSSSAAGGPLFNVIPASILYNPALPASNEIITFDLSGTLLVNGNEDEFWFEDDSYGGAFEGGILVPTKFATFTATTSGVFCEMIGMPVRKVWDVHAGASKDVLDWLSVGANMYYRAYMGEGSDFAIGGDLGALAKLGDFGSVKNVRFGVSLLNIGKPADYPTLGMDWFKENSKYPSILTPRAGIAAQVFETGNWKGAFSADVCIPLLINNFITDAAFEFEYKDSLKLTVGWQYNVREAIEAGSNGVNLFSVGVSYRFGTKAGSITPALASQYLYSGIWAVSGGARMDLGQKDTSGAEIEMW